MFNFFKEKKQNENIEVSSGLENLFTSCLTLKTGIKVLQVVSQILILLWRKESKYLEPRKVIIAPSKTSKSTGDLLRAVRAVVGFH